MPREFGQLDAAAWREDDDWRALPADAQWLYALLVSQGDLSAAGVLMFAASRWQRMCADMTPDRFTEALAALEAHRFIFVDLDDLEVLIRSYARRKTQWANPRRRAAVRNAAVAMHSVRLRTALAVDLSRLDVPADAEGLRADMRSILAALPSITPSDVALFSPEGLPGRLAEPFAEVTAGLSPMDSAERFRAGAPQTPEAIRTEAQTPEAGAASPPATAKRGTRIPEPFAIADEMWTWAQGERLPDGWVLRVTESFVDYWRAKPGAGGVKLDWPATWRTWLRREAERSPPQGAPFHADDRYAGHLALIEHFDRQEGA